MKHLAKKRGVVVAVTVGWAIASGCDADRIGGGGDPARQASVQEGISTLRAIDAEIARTTKGWVQPADNPGLRKLRSFRRSVRAELLKRNPSLAAGFAALDATMSNAVCEGGSSDDSAGCDGGGGDSGGGDTGGGGGETGGGGGEESGPAFVGGWNTPSVSQKKIESWTRIGSPENSVHYDMASPGKYTLKIQTHEFDPVAWTDEWGHPNSMVGSFKVVPIPFMFTAQAGDSVHIFTDVTHKGRGDNNIPLADWPSQGHDAYKMPAGAPAKSGGGDEEVTVLPCENYRYYFSADNGATWHYMYTKCEVDQANV